MTTCYIYALVDSQTGEEFYVGSSIWPTGRFSAHTHGATNEANQERIKQIRANGYEPVMHILDEVSEELRLEKEREWIDRLQKKGMPLTNMRLIDSEKVEKTLITPRIPFDLYIKLKIKAARTGRTMNGIIIESLQKWLELEKEGDEHIDEVQGV
jgi:hypothetical protein